MLNIDNLFDMAESTGVSDIYITAGMPIQVRFNGEIKDAGFGEMTSEEINKFLGSIMSVEHQEKLKEGGEAVLSFDTKKAGRFRAGVYRQRGMYSVALRTIPCAEKFNFEELNIPKEVTELAFLKKGLVLVSGPLGGGKSMTLAALVDKVNVFRAAHVVTLEEPVEYIHRRKKSIISQREMGGDFLSYSAAVNAALKENPDVIMIGEMKSAETMKSALYAAEAGCLVIASVCALGAENVLRQIFGMLASDRQLYLKYQLAESLVAIVSQQLLPSARDKKCVPVFELMKMNPKIYEMICSGRISHINDAMSEDGRSEVKTMDDAILELYLRGTITREAVIENAVNSAAVEKRLL